MRSIDVGQFRPTPQGGTGFLLNKDNLVVHTLALTVKSNTGEELSHGISENGLTTAVDCRTNQVYTDRILKMTNASGTVLVEVSLPNDAFAVSGVVKINVHKSSVNHVVEYIAIGEE